MRLNPVDKPHGGALMFVVAYLILIEGVLWSRQTWRPVMEGWRLTAALAERDRVLLATTESTPSIRRRLRTEGLLDETADVLDNSLDLPPIPLWQRQIEVARVENPTLAVLTDDPAVVEWTLEAGAVALLFAHPGHSGPPRRPQQGSRSWASLLDELGARK